MTPEKRKEVLASHSLSVKVKLAETGKKIKKEIFLENNWEFSDQFCSLARVFLADLSS
ncbi:hypothetical protein L873DRAFT_1823717 [Choiromyces venosus 120613-1]|uniref:Uncharacterized protein n=1 Tax=Choiromyces venosus 120613-1 TaxID=1336337 RepID=A0A3N4IS02_9PEZI|nr:hypothetical protein L873DRAFT_1823717 [Choiromyces venosus 120613-1]